MGVGGGKEREVSVGLPYAKEDPQDTGGLANAKVVLPSSKELTLRWVGDSKNVTYVPPRSGGGRGGWFAMCQPFALFCSLLPPWVPVVKGSSSLVCLFLLKFSDMKSAKIM